MTPSILLAFFFGGAPGTPELLLVLLAVLVLFGAKRLPEIARGLGKSMEEFKRAARDVTDEIMHADPDKPPPPKPIESPDSVSRLGSEEETDAEEDAEPDAAPEDDADAGPR